MIGECYHHLRAHSFALRSQQVSRLLPTSVHMYINFLFVLCHDPNLHALPQDGWTAVMLAARCGHQSLVQELCETFGADFLHTKKVRAMQTLSE